MKKNLQFFDVLAPSRDINKHRHFSAAELKWDAP